MLTEAEFAEAVEAVRNDHEPSIPDLIAHDRAQRAEIERLRASLRWHREDLDLRIAELRLWLKRHQIADPATTEFWSIIANKRPQCAISDPGDPNDLGLNLAQRNERLAQRNERLNAVVATLEHGRGALVDEVRRQEARAEKAEAERDSLRNRLKPSLEYVEGTACGYGDDEIDRLTEQIQELKLAILAALTKAGLAMLEENPITPWEVNAAIARLARERDSERARAEKYLAAMTALVETDGTDAEWLAPLAAIRALVEEARRG